VEAGVSSCLPPCSQEETPDCTNQLLTAQISYFVAVPVVSCGEAAGSAGFCSVGCVSCFAAGTSFIIVPVALLAAMYVRYIDVIIKIAAHPTVSLLKKVAGPELPKSVWLDDPPNDAPMLAPFPACSRMTMIRNTLTRTWRIIIAVCILLSYLLCL